MTLQGKYELLTDANYKGNYRGLCSGTVLSLTLQNSNTRSKLSNNTIKAFKRYHKTAQ